MFFLHKISLFSAVTAFNKRDTYRCSQRSKVNWFIFSSLGHYYQMLTAAELKRKRVSLHIDITCKMYRSILSPAPMCWTLVLVLLQHFFCIHFRNEEIHDAVWQRRQLADPVSRLQQRSKVFAQHFSGGRWAREESQVLRDPSFSHWFGVFPAVLLEM